MSPDQLDVTFAALSDPTRRAILSRLASGEASVTQLMEPFELSQPAISKHLQVLQRAGLISRSRAAQKRPCKLETAPLKEAADWIGYYRRFWTESFDRLDGYLADLQAGAQKGKKTTAKKTADKKTRSKKTGGKPHGRE
jgi:DNA-binding transcriptional ArsR family regulator